MNTNDENYENSNNYIHFCSLGTLCYSSTFLQRGQF